jgi:glutamyl-tRNA(Gln) amidotransferase subunit E
MGVAGIFHSDELPAYGITKNEVEMVRKHLEMSKEDAFILVADEEEKSRNALIEVQRRARTAMVGVPEETRKALEDANTEYLRPLPTASRMYVETDIPAQVISENRLKDIRSDLPELPAEKKDRIIKEYGLSEDLASQLVRQDKADQFELIMKQCEVDSTTAASTMAYTLKELRREGLDVDILTDQVFLNTFGLVKDGSISKEAITPVIRETIMKGTSPEQSAKNLNLVMLSEDQVREIIQKITTKQAAMIKERGPGSMGPLMGMAMKELKGKADGKIVNKILRDEMNNLT